MINPRIPVTEDELHAYVDDELPAERRGDVEAWLAAHADDAERVRSWRAMAQTLHARYDAVADEPVPQRLDVDRLVREPRKWMYGAIAATLLAFIGGGAAGWLARGAAAAPCAIQPTPPPAMNASRDAAIAPAIHLRGCRASRSISSRFGTASSAIES